MAFLNLISDYLSTGYHNQGAVSTQTKGLEQGAVNNPQTPNPVLLCEVLVGNALSAEEQELLIKMLSSINLYIDKNCVIKIDNTVAKDKMILKLNENFKITTYHPGVILQDESKKRPVWEDLKKLKAKIENTGEK